MILPWIIFAWLIAVGVIMVFESPCDPSAQTCEFDDGQPEKE